MPKTDYHPLCPNCRYDLHCLRGSTCPECGAHVDLDALSKPDFTEVDPYVVRLVLMSIGLLLAVPSGFAFVSFVAVLVDSRTILDALSAIPNALGASFMVLHYWPPALVLFTLSVSVGFALFIAALTRRHRWYLALIGLLLVDAGWIVAIWRGIQYFVNV